MVVLLLSGGYSAKLPNDTYWHLFESQHAYIQFMMNSAIANGDCTTQNTRINGRFGHDSLDLPGIFSSSQLNYLKLTLDFLSSVSCGVFFIPWQASGPWDQPRLAPGALGAPARCATASLLQFGSNLQQIVLRNAHFLRWHETMTFEKHWTTGILVIWGFKKWWSQNSPATMEIFFHLTKNGCQIQLFKVILGWVDDV